MMTDVFLAIGIVLTLGLSFFFSLSETAILSMSRYRLRFILENQAKPDPLLQKFLERPETALTPILVGNTLVNVGGAFMTSVLVTDLLQTGVLRVGNEIAQAAASILVTIAILICGEVTPKAIAARYPETFALKIAGPLRMISYLLSPLVMLSLSAGNALIRLLTRNRPHSHLPRLSLDELKAIITHHGDTSLPAGAVEMIQNIFEFPLLTVRDIMVSRKQVITVPVRAGLAELISLFLKYDYSQMPVHDGNPDNILGVLEMRDLFREAVKVRSGGGAFSLARLLRPPVFLPETSSVTEVLRMFQRSRNHFAIVVDEFGQFDGIVTIEDVLEEIVGEIQARHGDSASPVRRLEPGRFLLDGLLPVRQFNRIFPEPLPAGESYSTVAGFLMSELGRLPASQETIEWRDYRFIVHELEGHRIHRVMLVISSLIPAAAVPPEETGAGPA